MINWASYPIFVCLKFEDSFIILMLNICRSEKQLPIRQKFSYRTAQQYCQLVQKSIKKQRSLSKDQKKFIQSSTYQPAEQSIKMIDKSKDKLRHLVIRSKLSERSLSKDQSRNSDQQLASIPKNVLCPPSSRRRLLPPSRNIVKRNITNYEQEHLIVSLEDQNKQLADQIGKNEKKLQKVKAQIEDQRIVQNMQRQMYKHQINKLRDTLSRQINTRSTTAEQDDQCSFARDINEDFSLITE